MEVVCICGGWGRAWGWGGWWGGGGAWESGRVTGDRKTMEIVSTCWGRVGGRRGRRPVVDSHVGQNNLVVYVYTFLTWDTRTSWCVYTFLTWD